MDMFKALQTAIKSEIGAQRMYDKMADEAPNPEVKSLFSYLAGYELTHQQFLEAEVRALQAAHEDPHGMPSYWLKMLNEKLQLPINEISTGDLDEIQRGLFAAQSIANVLKQANDELLKKQVRYEQELYIASDIQHKLLPQELPDDAGLQIAAVNIMARSVGGDYYDFMKDERGQLAMVVADSMGKGMPAALLMTTVRAVWRAWSVSGIESPGETLEIINKTIYPDLSSIESYVTMFNALYDPGTSAFRYSNAGHNPPIYRPSSSPSCVNLETGGVPVGMFSESKFNSDSFIMNKDDIAVIYTDGVIEARDSKSDEFGFDRLCQIINENHRYTPDDIANIILSAVKSHTGSSSLSDDVTIVVLKRL